MERIDEQSSAVVSPAPQPTTPRGIDRWAAFAVSISLSVSAPPIHSSRTAYTQLESHSKEKLLPRSSRPSRPACGAVSYGMLCHSCGFWLVTKPDSFLGLFTVFDSLSAHRFGTILRHYIVIKYVQIFWNVGKMELPKKNPEGRLKHTVRKQPWHLHYLHSCLCVL